MSRGRPCRQLAELRMRLALVLGLSLVVSGCAIVRKDKEEPVGNPASRTQEEPTQGPASRTRQEPAPGSPSRGKSGPVLKPSDVLKPDSQVIPSPITDHFSMRVIYFQPSVT